MHSLRLCLGIFFACLPFASHADWHVASSNHFVIYADDSERDLRRFSERLERYRAAMNTVFSMGNTAPSPSNRLTIYVVDSVREVQRLLGPDSQNVTGFYMPRAGGALAVIPPLSSSSNSESQTILLHEYAHHFMYENMRLLVPRWYSEGFAEYFATAEFPSADGVNIGVPAYGRAQNLLMGISAELETLLDSTAFAEERGRLGTAGLYASSWLLMHYLYADNAGRAKVLDYIARLNTGASELDAARAAFGDLEQLERDLRRYLERGRLGYWKLADLETGPIDIRQLNDGEAAIMPVMIRSKVGVDEMMAAEVVVQARAIAAEFPDEPAVQAALSEAEFDAGDDAAAIAAADRALAVNPAQMTALIQKGNALTRMALEEGTEEAWTAARQHYLAVNRIENDHPVPLVAYYTNFVAQGLKPTENAVLALERALELAPYDANTRVLATQYYMRESRYADAIRTIRPLAYKPHASEDNPAVTLLQEAEREYAAQGGVETAPTPSPSANSTAP